MDAIYQQIREQISRIARDRGISSAGAACIWGKSRVHGETITPAREDGFRGGAEMESSYFCGLIACPGRRVSLRRRFTLLLSRDTRWNGRGMLRVRLGGEASGQPWFYIRAHRKRYMSRNKLALTTRALRRGASMALVERHSWKKLVQMKPETFRSCGLKP